MSVISQNYLYEIFLISYRKNILVDSEVSFCFLNKQQNLTKNKTKFAVT